MGSVLVATKASIKYKYDRNGCNMALYTTCNQPSTSQLHTLDTFC